MPRWWNWQTRRVEVSVPKGMRVQIPPWAPNKRYRNLYQSVKSNGDETGKHVRRAKGRRNLAPSRNACKPLALASSTLAHCFNKKVVNIVNLK